MIKMIENELCCGKCRFFHPERRECRRNPPQVWADEETVGYCFPRVKEEEWCGEFQPEQKRWVVPEGFDIPGEGVIHEVKD